MESILFIAHTLSDGTLPKVAYEAFNAALSLSKGLGGTQVTVGLIGKDVQAAADSLGAYDNARFLAVSGDDFADSRYSTDVAAFEAIAKTANASIIIAPSTSRNNRCLPGLALRLGGKIDTHICSLESKDGTPLAQRWYYRQRIIASLSRAQRPWLMLVDSGSFAAFQGEKVSTKIENVSVSVTANMKRTTVEGIKAPLADAQTIRPDAKLLFVAGAGWTKKQSDGQAHLKEAESLILGFLEGSKASLGSSKSLVDQSGEGHDVLKFMTHMNQVGQTGATPRHPKGLSTCCHGEEPHVVGWRFINDRRAINADPNCGWAQGKADVLYVADAFKVMAKVNELLNK